MCVCVFEITERERERKNRAKKRATANDVGSKLDDSHMLKFNVIMQAQWQQQKRMTKKQQMRVVAAVEC
jgi:hypothetical protein